MSTSLSVQRQWIAAEFSKGVQAEQDLCDLAKTRALSPPDPSLQVLYHEIAASDERHRAVVDTIATRYGHTPSRTGSGGIGETLGRLKAKVGEIGSTPIRIVGEDLAAKGNAVHWYRAWVKAFEAIGDVESSRELADVLAEEKSHLDALQEGLNRLVYQGVIGEEHPAS